ncbi:MAG: hypothetical protein JO234_16455, partial [Hyphomicrobiales bacterium]|nr:hypothetical protein [Hyphomicrobiales bacterium]
MKHALISRLRASVAIAAALATLVCAAGAADAADGAALRDKWCNKVH